MTEILITGASGFVGSALVRKLVSQHFRVRAAVRKPQKQDGVSFCVVGDVGLETNWHEAVNGVDVIVHLAARVHVMEEQAKEALTEFMKTNVECTRKLAEVAASAGVKRFVYVSSIKVNGEVTRDIAFSEFSQPDPQDPYAISKYRAELALFELSKNTGMEVVIVRPPLVYGPRVKANFLTLMKIVNKKIPLPFKDVINKRSLVYVGNLVDALKVCATHPKAAGKVFLVSDNEDVSTPELMNKIASSLNVPSRIFYFPISIMSFLARVLGKKASVDRLTQSLEIDSSKIRKELDWHPPYTMDQGLKITADWYIENLKASKK